MRPVLALTADGALLVALAASLVAAAGGAALAVRRARTHGRVGLGDLVVGTVVGGGIVLAVVLLGQPIVGLDVWGVAHVAYRLATVGLPIGVVVVVVAVVGDRRDERRAVPATGAQGPGQGPVRAAPIVAPTASAPRDGTGRAGSVTGPAVVALVLGLLAAPVGWWASVVAPDRLEVQEPTVVLAGRAGQEPLRIGVLSDLQTRSVGPHEQEAVDRLLGAHPDLILVPGDVYQGDPGSLPDQLDALRALVGRLHAPGGVYVVQGDVDPPGQLARIVEGTGARLLHDEVVRIDVRDRHVTLAGLDLDVTSSSATAALARLEADAGADDVRLVVAHRPDAVLRLPVPTRVDLVVAGHTHGGQVSVPGYGPPLTLSAVPRPVAAGGLHELDGRRVFVSKGVGMERGQAPPVRLGVTPDIGIITLTSA